MELGKYERFAQLVFSQKSINFSAKALIFMTIS